uniref:Uncharacterized protein n=1 Tax=Oryza brachyantha TaxID=4533 RepID=J3LNS5_ORYBR
MPPGEARPRSCDSGCLEAIADSMDDTGNLKLQKLETFPDIHDPQIQVYMFLEKYETCSFPVLKDELEYFCMVLDLYFKYNITFIDE